MQGLMMDYQLTLDRILEHAQRMFPHKQVSTKLPDGTLHRYTYANFAQRTKRLANILRQLGVQKGDRVGTFAWNNYQHLELYYAIPGCGAVWQRQRPPEAVLQRHRFANARCRSHGCLQNFFHEPGPHLPTRARSRPE